jgi:hypothetical protein
MSSAQRIDATASQRAERIIETKAAIEGQRTTLAAFGCAEYALIGTSADHPRLIIEMEEAAR